MKAVPATLLPMLACVMMACAAPHPSRVVIGIGMTENTHAAFRLAVREINAAGGIHQVPVELSGLEWAATDSYTPAAILKTTARFNATPNLVAVVGHNDSASTLSAAASYNRDGIPQIVTIATNPAITNIGSWTYRLCLSDAAQGPALATYAVQDWRKSRIAIIYVNDDYGRGLARLFEDRARSLGAQIVATAMHHNTLQPEDEASIRETIEDLKKIDPDLVALFQRVDAARWTVQAIRAAGLRADILGGDNLAQYSFARDAPGPAEGVRVSQFLDLDVRRPRVARFVEGIRAATGQAPDYAQAYAYDALYLLRDAIAQGGFSRAGVKSYLDAMIAKGQRIEGVTGTFVLAADHDARRPLYVAEVRDGGFRVLKALPAGQAPQ